MIRRPIAVALAASAGLVFPVLGAAAAPASAITASKAWSRPVAPGLPTGVVYLTVHNGGRAPDRLVGAATPVAASAGLHQSMRMGAMMSMQPVPGGLSLAPGATVTLAPGGYHLMLEGLKHGLRVGQRYPLTLRFAYAKPMTVQVEVRPTAP